MTPAMPAPTRSAPERAVVDDEAAAAPAVLAVGAAVVLDAEPVREVTMPLEVELAIELEPDCDEALDDDMDDDLEEEPEVIDAEADEAEALADAVAPPETARLAAPPPIVPTVVHAEVAPAG